MLTLKYRKLQPDIPDVWNYVQIQMNFFTKSLFLLISHQKSVMVFGLVFPALTCEMFIFMYQLKVKHVF